MSSIDGELAWRGEALSQLQQEVTLLTLRAIAERVQAAAPEAAMVGLARTDQPPGDYRIPYGYYTADGRRIVEGDGPGWEAKVDDAIVSLCSRLDDSNAGTWEPFTSAVAGDPYGCDRRLLLGDTLCIELDSRAGHSLRFHDATLIWVGADEETPSDQYCLDIHGVSILTRRRMTGPAVGTYMHIDTVHVANQAAGPLEIEVNNRELFHSSVDGSAGR